MHDIYLKGCCSPYGTHSALSRSSVVTISGYAKLSDDPLISRYLNGIVWTFSHAEMKSCSFSITSQFNFKNGHFFSNLRTGKMEILITTNNWLLKWSSWLAALKKFIQLKVLDKQASWTYVRLIFELFLVISWLWFALDRLRCWEDRC